ncbi:MAG: DUF6691 family protein [Pseudomonadota bacterium]
MKALVGLICGLIFGVGLAMSGMTNTAVVLGFLDVAGPWNPTLAFVMGAAVLVSLIGFQIILRMKRPVLNPRFALPKSTVIDSRLLLGAAIFGIGWGIYGYCPGPALAALGYLDHKTGIFVIAMLIGMALANKLASR